MNREDESIKRDIKDTLYRNSRVSGSNVSVNVTGGTAFLEGSTRSHEERQIIVADTWSVPGVRDVQDRLAVEYEKPLPPDDELLNRAGRVLEWNPEIEDRDITPSVSVLQIVVLHVHGANLPAPESCCWVRRLENRLPWIRPAGYNEA
jgi:hypothetical protein